MLHHVNDVGGGGGIISSAGRGSLHRPVGALIVRTLDAVLVNFVCGWLHPLHPIDVTHMTNHTRPPSIFAALLFPCFIICKPKNKKLDWPRNE